MIDQDILAVDHIRDHHHVEEDILVLLLEEEILDLLHVEEILILDHHAEEIPLDHQFLEEILVLQSVIVLQ